MSAPEKIFELVERFDLHKETYLSGNYKEAQLRKEFIDPFFKELGWDMDNERGYAEAYKDVIHEDSIKIGNNPEAPDYCFRIGGTRKFFLEAKKPSTDIRRDIHPAYQLRRYAWSSKLPLSILTNFEEFAVYDCRIKPSNTDDAKNARIEHLSYTHYPERWDKIASIFSREAVLKGSFDKYAETSRGKKGTSEVDVAFLKEIESWRDVLARTIAIRNPALSRRDLNFTVQRTIDRIIFLRICEDRSIEEYQSLMALLNGNNVYSRLRDMFYKADQRYNSGLFHFSHEKNEAEPPDELTLGLSIDDKPLKDIIRCLYYPESPYEFSVLPADILGQVYEQFLGKVIRLTDGHRAVVEDKPEVKKAGGVYYTPTYIVDYIVKNTVGKLLEGKTPDSAASLRILDPACGSGSFLIGAYQYLLDWHLTYYTVHTPEKWTAGRKPRLVEKSARDYRLTTDERKRILLNSIYGVDIDPQAVEVTKLSLLLKVLEGESRQTLESQLKLFHERALPDLGSNIKCGNSLIGPDFYDGAQIDLFDEEERYRINVFDWKHEFKDIFDSGGFDAVLGNPPYVRPHKLQSEIKDYFWQHFTTFVKKSDLYCCFIEKAVSLLKKGGFFGYIVSNGFLRLDSFEKLRTFLLDQTMIKKIIDFKEYVFDRANVKTAILLLIKNGSCGTKSVQVAISEVIPDLEKVKFKTIMQDAFRQTYKSIFDLSLDEFQDSYKLKMQEKSVNLGSIFDLSFGLKTGDDAIFLTYSPKNSEYKPLIRGKDVHSYSLIFKGEYVWYVPNSMIAHRKTARPGTPERFEQPKVLIRDTGGGLQGTFDGKNYYVKDVIVVSDINKDEKKLKFLTGILNSTLMKFYYETSFPTLHVQRNELASLPIRSIDFSSPADVARHDRMVSLVEAMLALNRQLAAAQTAQDKTAIQRQLDATDNQIDRLVYELYGLTEEEIGIVEDSAGK